MSEEIKPEVIEDGTVTPDVAPQEQEPAVEAVEGTTQETIEEMTEQPVVKEDGEEGKQAVEEVKDTVE